MEVKVIDTYCTIVPNHTCESYCKEHDKMRSQV